MDSENSSVFTLITRLCEKILDEPLKYNDRSSRFAGVKKLRTRAYSMLLNPADHDLPPSPHDCFVKVIATAFDNGILHDNVYSEEFNRCVDHLLLESNKITYIPSVVYFLANMYNERQTMDVLFKDTGADENENFSSLGFSASILPKKYHLYHPSSFILPDLHSSMSNNAKINYLMYSQKIQNNSVVRPICNFQCNFKITKFPEKTFKNSSFSPFPSLTRDQHEITWNHLEDEGYVSPGATPLGTTPGELSAPPWYELDLDFNSNQKARHLTWESLGEPTQAKEKPPLFEAGVEALHCNLKIRENLLLTLDPRISIQLRDPIHWKSLLHHVTFLIMGLESQSFIFNEQFDRFELVEGIWLEGISYEALSACLADFIVMGTCFRRLLSFVETPSSDGYIEGIVQQVIRKSTGRYLHLYRGACLLVMHDLLQRKSFSILLMRLRLKGLQQQILCLASAYGKWGSGAPIPSGVEALGHLHRHASGAQRKDIASLFRYILHAGCIVYFNILERWVYDGEIVDGGDFFVVQRLEYLSCHNRRYWTRAFQFNAAAVPEFLCGLKPFLLRCGKSVHFLKICDPKHPSLQDGQSLLASLKQTHSLTISSEVQIESTESVEESKVPLENVESLPSEPSEESKPLEEEPPHPSISEVDSKINEEYEEETDSLEILEERPSKLRGEVKELLNDEEEKIIEEEKKKLIEYYDKLGEASDKRRVRAEWRVHRMGLRTGDSMPCTRDGASGGASLQTVHTEQPDHNRNNVTSEEESPDREAFEEESQETQASEHQGEEDVTVKSEVEREIVKVEENVSGMEDVGEESCDDVELVVDLSEECSEVERTEETMDLKKETSDVEEEMCQENIQDLTPSNLSYFKSPNRTPLKKLSGLFPFNPHLHGSERESKENNQEEALPWPYRSVLYSLMMHSNKMDAALLHWMLVEKGLVSHLRSLRAYFFLLDGEFGRRLSEDLFSAMRRAPGGKPSIEYLNVLSLSRILSHALASSTFAASDPNATLFSLNLSQCPEQTPGVDPLTCVHMLYKAPWPLNVILTEEAVSKYSRVLDLLLRLKHASWALEQTFLHLRVLEPGKGIAKVFPRRWRSPHEAVQNSPQYHQLQLYRHQMMHLVCAVQSYITSGVLQASGKKLDEAIASSSCLDEFYAEHVLYVKKILFGCLLNKRSETIANILNDILRLIMKFHWSLCSRSWYIPPDQETSKSCHYEHPNFKVLCKIYGAFEDMTDFLLKYAWRLASHGYQADLFELLQMINVNNFY